MTHAKKRTFFLRFFAVLMCVFFFASSASAQEESVTVQDRADLFFNELFRKENPVGAVVMISQKDRVLYTYTMGYADRKNKAETQTDSLFKIASASKLITALGLMQLCEKENIDFDAPLGELYQKKVVNPLRNDAPITLRQVMSHTSSIMETANYYPQWGDSEQAKHYFTHYLPGTHYEYANLNGGIVGNTIERLSGQSVHDYMTENFFSPMDIDAAYSPLLLKHPEKMSCTYMKDGSVYMNQQNYLNNAASYDNSCDPDHHYRNGVGNIWMSAEGLSKFGQMLASGGTWGGKTYLLPETIHLMCADQSRIKNSSVSCESPYGLSMHRLEYESLQDIWYGHQGGWQGLVCDLYFEPSTQMSVVMIANGSPHRRQNSETADIFIKTLAFVTDTWMNSLIADWQ